MKSICSSPHYSNRASNCHLALSWAADARCQVVVSGNLSPLVEVASNIDTNANIALAGEFLIRPIWFDPAYLAEVDDTTLGEQD